MYKKMLIHLLLIIGVFSGCTTKIPIKDVTTSQQKYSVGDKAIVELNLINDLKDKKITEGKFEKVLVLEYQNKDMDGYEFIFNNLKKEIEARNLPINLVKSSNSNNNLYLNNFKINSQQTSGFSPLITLTKIKLTLEKDNEKHNIVSVVKRAKMLMLSITESYEPLYYQPSSIITQEIVAKLNKAFFNYKLEDNEVKSLITLANKQIETKDELTYLTVYKLGLSNNILALDFIVEHTKPTYPDYIRFASISTLGMLGGEKYLGNLMSIYNDDRYAWEDKVMALKSIGDINSKEANNFLEKTYKILSEKKEDFYIKAQKDTIELYIK
ncbi:hypothetical protein HMPREF9401_1761 [Aliarcobacter butzleri JV22]|uniref:hypothetical protein n=1 Tax=Aliarcobacter butzleri TaxID=28197 RepID=UPI0001F12D8A|nr:hypothetical protein [Aliarcobacter butzleri]EFU69373.1 hypothetical protein HMPREF9401_1761 [Aliarcobacter butzleri JV22]